MSETMYCVPDGVPRPSCGSVGEGALREIMHRAIRDAKAAFDAEVLSDEALQQRANAEAAEKELAAKRERYEKERREGKTKGGEPKWSEHPRTPVSDGALLHRSVMIPAFYAAVKAIDRAFGWQSKDIINGHEDGVRMLAPCEPKRWPRMPPLVTETQQADMSAVVSQLEHCSLTGRRSRFHRQHSSAYVSQWQRSSVHSCREEGHRRLSA